MSHSSAAAAAAAANNAAAVKSVEPSTCSETLNFTTLYFFSTSRREQLRLRQLVRFRNWVVDLTAPANETFVREPVMLEKNLPSTGYDYVPLGSCPRQQIQAAQALLESCFPDPELLEYVRDVIAASFLPLPIADRLQLQLPPLSVDADVDGELPGDKEVVKEEEEDPEAMWGRLLPASRFEHVLCGPPASGKTFFLLLIRMLHGKRATAAGGGFSDIGAAQQHRVKLNTSGFGRRMCVTDERTAFVDDGGEAHTWRALPCARSPAAPRPSLDALRNHMCELLPVFAAQAILRLRQLYTGRAAPAAEAPPRSVAAASAALFRSITTAAAAAAAAVDAKDSVGEADDDDATSTANAADVTLEQQDQLQQEQQQEQLQQPPPPPPILMIVAAAVAGTALAVHVGTCNNRQVKAAAGVAAATVALAIALHMTGMCWFK